MAVACRLAALVAALLPAGIATAAAPLADVQDRGRALYRYDRAAWLATDDLRAHLPATRMSEVGGWVVTPAGAGLRVDFFGKDAARDRTVYTVDVGETGAQGGRSLGTKAAPPLSSAARRSQAAMIAAEAELLRHGDWRPCTPAPFNTVVLPPDADGTVSVYFLTSQTEAARLPFGGHYRIDIAADGTVSASRAFAKSCLTMQRPPAAGGPAPAALVVSDLLDAQPTEIHVFEQLYLGLPLVVQIAAPPSTWLVLRGTVRPLPPRP